MRRLFLTCCLALAVLAFVMSPVGAAAIGAVQGYHQMAGNYGYLGTPDVGVLGTSLLAFGAGVEGTNANYDGVRGMGYQGVYGYSGAVGGTGLYGEVSSTDANAAAVYGFAPTTAFAGLFDGNVKINGTITKSAGSFRIDHPLDPANKFLSHSFVESPDMKNIYDGVAVLDGRGEATVILPAWFEALNRDFRYQLTCIGEHAPVFVAQKIHENRFTIAGGYEGMEVSWQVTGSRRDPYALAYPIAVEELKPIEARGRFIHPELYRQPEAMSIDAKRRARHARTHQY